ncbi:MAG: hypothetical protein M3335_00120 [Actinomycetota bacterium]|nr:hypothetical protein [Actinomycetota bacterium]
MSITISRDERDALYDRIVICLTRIDDVYRAVEEGDWPEAQSLSEEFSDLLRLVCSDLGWGEGTKDSYTLQTPPEVLRRALESLQELAGKDRAHFEGERDKLSEDVDDSRHLEETCARILGGL